MSQQPTLLDESMRTAGMTHHPRACLWIWSLCVEIVETSCGSTADVQRVEHILWSTATSLIELAQVLGADGCMQKTAYCQCKRREH